MVYWNGKFQPSSKFPRGNIDINKNMLSETKILTMIESGELLFPPLKFRLLKKNVRNKDWGCDAVLEAAWNKEKFTFAAAIKRYSSDRTVFDAIRESSFVADKLSAFPIVITPWLSEEQVLNLEAEGVSGIDLCGNGVIVIPGKVLIIRSGKPNAYRDSRTVKNVYEGTSSLVARAFLLKPSYKSVTEIVEEIQSRSGTITQPTVSKALKQLEADVVIWKEKGLIKLVQAEKLLDRLVANGKKPERLAETAGKLQCAQSDVSRVIANTARKVSGARTVVTGACSVNQYATMAREPLVEMYCDIDPSRLVSALNKQVDSTSRFPNFRLIQTDDPTVFFDARTDNEVEYSSPLQCYLELMQGDKREREAAAQVRELILKGIEEPSQVRIP